MSGSFGIEPCCGPIGTDEVKTPFSEGVFRSKQPQVDEFDWACLRAFLSSFFILIVSVSFISLYSGRFPFN